MKELSIEEKAKAYDEAVKVIKDNLDALNEITETGVEVVNIQSIKNCFYRAFSELKESEDERIRGAIIDHLKDNNLTEWAAWFEKQGKQSIKWHKNTEGNKPQKNHSVLIKTTHGIGEGEWNGGEHWIQYRWSGSIKDSDVLFWIELSDIEKQGEQKLIYKVEQNFVWSEEDEDMLQSILDEYKSMTTEKRNWLKSIKDIVQPQTKQEWSEEDKEIINNIGEYLNRYGNYILESNEEKAVDVYKSADWLKFLIERYNWKPSDVQMRILSIYADQNNTHGAVLTSLYQDLKKLK